MNAGAAFPRAARLLQPAQFASALKGRRVARGALFMLHAGPADGSGAARLGLVIGKRYAPLSVSRSAIKRVIRESFRQQRAVLPAADYAVRLHSRIKPVSLTVLKQQVRTEIDALFVRAARQAGSQPSRPRGEA
jgi:ribonuclease P protein component